MSRKPATEDDIYDVLAEKGPATWAEITAELRHRGKTVTEGDFSTGEKSLEYLVDDHIVRAERRRISKKDRRELEKLHGSSGKRALVPMEYSLTE